jgi:hypothetical protein
MYTLTPFDYCVKLGISIFVTLFRSITASPVEARDVMTALKNIKLNDNDEG